MTVFQFAQQLIADKFGHNAENLPNVAILTAREILKRFIFLFPQSIAVIFHFVTYFSIIFLIQIIYFLQMEDR